MIPTCYSSDSFLWEGVGDPFPLSQIRGLKGEVLRKFEWKVKKMTGKFGGFKKRH